MLICYIMCNQHTKSAAAQLSLKMHVAIDKIMFSSTKLVKHSGAINFFSVITDGTIEFSDMDPLIPLISEVS